MGAKPKLVLFVGAGFSKGIWNDAPLGDELFSAVWEKVTGFSSNGERCFLDTVAQLFPRIPQSDYKSISFETFLSLIFNATRDDSYFLRDIMSAEKAQHVYDMIVHGVA